VDGRAGFERLIGAHTAGVIPTLCSCSDFVSQPRIAAHRGLSGKKGQCPLSQLYRVRIRQTDIWPDYKGSDKDVLELEIYEHWLEKA
jgi:hypothetical protein